ncbi:MAG: DUF1554 domain-containing protein [Thermomicrobiales bacterium]
MDSPQFDALARRAARISRRSLAALVGGAAGVGAGLGAALDDAAPAGAKRRRVTGERNERGNKVIMCIGGETRKVPKKKRTKYLKQGATRGACATPAGCPSGQKACNGGCIAISACCTNADCASNEICESGVCVVPAVCGFGSPCRVFVSSTDSNGALGEVAGADARCQQLATAANLTGTYMAWIGDSTSAPATRFTDTNRAGPYHLVANGSDSGGVGPLVATDFATLISCPGSVCLQYNIDRDETGVQLGNTALVWTGVSSSGQAMSDTCNGWKDGTSSYQGRRGGSDRTNETWTQNGPDNCNSTFRIFCFEQPAVL